MTLFQSNLYMTVSAVIQTEDLVVVVDPAWLPHEVEEIRNYTYTILNGRPLYILFTHSDYDHIIGYKAFPEAIANASEALKTKSEEGKVAVVEQIKAFDDEYYIIRGYEIAFPVVDVCAAKDGDAFVLGSTRLVFYPAPGHNDDGMFTVIEPLGLLIAGDYFSNVEFPYIYFDSALYERSILKLDDIIARHDIRLLITGHGDSTDQRAEMKRRQSDSLEYIRAMRSYILAGDQIRIDGLIANCRFPRNMRKFHKNNQLLIQKELESRLGKDDGTML
ncbi:MBL fold metallo-hydrolase [Paenibacillus sp. sptzw28]|uniref:MBL fold metallo-hydrolase n=1 Tax=Paenibacillus sp. sptzw28 TaxID=715179 RepID=UPI002162BDD7|nr:MBL fold metallo-hydrolase [Paenibacillus sp. sptzw28]